VKELNEYEQRLEDIITISKVKDFDQLNSKQYRDLVLLRVIAHMPAHHMNDCVECMSEAQLSVFIKGAARWVLGVDSPSNIADWPMICSGESAVEAWCDEFRQDAEREFYAMLNKITEEDDERRAEGSMAEGV
jgi:hypothetical protein